ncbi:MAG: ornithine carbamoyltransferase [Candidatus Omnitrophica bacterium]|nr:ornithine carbamoyltransferase [Candidatus Omnitrophota bacterium]
MKHFISLKEFKDKDIYAIFNLTQKIKNNPSKFSKVLSGKHIGLLFEKPSLRTKVSFQVGINQLGGMALYLSGREVQLGERETVADIARTLSGYLDGMILRTFSHNTLLEFAKNSQIPVVNGLTDLLHPAQALSDLYTIYERKKNLKKLKVAFIGDGNNVCNSIMIGACILGMNLVVATPPGYEPNKNITKEVLGLAEKTKAVICFTNNPRQAAEDSDVLYTDVWVSMGKEKEQDARKKAFRRFQINSQILKLADKGCLVLHCLPAHRGEEITDEVIDGKNSIVFKQAENRLYVQKAILTWLFKGGKI